MSLNSMAAEKTRVAVLFSGVVSDQSWNQWGYQGLLRAKDDCGVDIAYSEKVPQDEQLEVFRSYAIEGYDVVIGMGADYTDSAQAAASQYPNVNFSVSNGQVSNGKNLSSTMLSATQMSYLEGVLAALITKTGKIAMVSGQPLPIVKQGEESFERGAGSILGKDVTVQFVYTESWDDVSKAREAGLALIANGVDVVAHHLDTADAGLISAAEDSGVYAIGLYRDSSLLGPKAVIGSSIGSPTTLVYQAACGHTLNGKVNYITVNTPNGISMHVTDLCSLYVKEKIKDTIKKMKSGEIYVKP